MLFRSVVDEDSKPTKGYQTKKKVASQRMAKSPTAPKVKVPKESKTVHPDGTVFFREDRQKWIAMWNGKQEAARPTPEACLAFLKKKYNVDGVVLNKE